MFRPSFHHLLHHLRPLPPLPPATMTCSTTPTPLPRTLYPPQIPLAPHDFSRADTTPDTRFYTQPRFVQHIDEAAIEALKKYYEGVIHGGEDVLDLCSSWTSHLPDLLRGRLGSCVGVGLNAEEMRANGFLTRCVVRDLNADASLVEIASGTVDTVICNVSIDYLIAPVRVLQEVRRCLKVGGRAHLAFSNRCFPTKVIGKWLRMDDVERRRWVGSYFWASEGWEEVEELILRDGADWGDPLFVVRARKEGLENNVL